MCLVHIMLLHLKLNILILFRKICSSSPPPLIPIKDQLLRDRKGRNNPGNRWESNPWPPEFCPAGVCSTALLQPLPIVNCCQICVVTGEAVRDAGHQSRRQLRRLLPHRSHHGGGSRTSGLPQQPAALLRWAGQHAEPQSLIRNFFSPMKSGNQTFDNFFVLGSEINFFEF